MGNSVITNAPLFIKRPGNLSEDKIKPIEQLAEADLKSRIKSSHDNFYNYYLYKPLEVIGIATPTAPHLSMRDIAAKKDGSAEAIEAQNCITSRDGYQAKHLEKIDTLFIECNKSIKEISTKTSLNQQAHALEKLYYDTLKKLENIQKQELEDFKKWFDEIQSVQLPNIYSEFKNSENLAKLRENQIKALQQRHHQDKEYFDALKNTLANAVSNNNAYINAGIEGHFKENEIKAVPPGTASFSPDLKIEDGFYDYKGYKFEVRDGATTLKFDETSRFLSEKEKYMMLVERATAVRYATKERLKKEGKDPTETPLKIKISATVTDPTKFFGSKEDRATSNIMYTQHLLSMQWRAAIEAGYSRDNIICSNENFKPTAQDEAFYSRYQATKSYQEIDHTHKSIKGKLMKQLEKTRNSKKMLDSAKNPIFTEEEIEKINAIDPFKIDLDDPTDKSISTELQTELNKIRSNLSELTLGKNPNQEEAVEFIREMRLAQINNSAIRDFIRCARNNADHTQHFIDFLNPNEIAAINQMVVTPLNTPAEISNWIENNINNAHPGSLGLNVNLKQDLVYKGPARYGYTSYKDTIQDKLDSKKVTAAQNTAQPAPDDGDMRVRPGVR